MYRDLGQHDLYIKHYTEQGKTNVLQDCVKCVLHTECITKEVVFVTFVLL